MSEVDATTAMIRSEEGCRAPTQARMLEAAIAIIDAEGESAVRVRDVSAAAGVSYASLYHFFGNREGLIDAAQAERYRRSLSMPIAAFAALLRECRSERQFRSLVETTMQRMFEPDRVPQRWVRATVLGNAASRPRLRRQLNTAMAAFEAELAEALLPAQEKGWIRSDLDLAAFACWWNGTITSRLVLEMSQGRIDAKAWDRIMIDATLAALTGAPSR